MKADTSKHFEMSPRTGRDSLSLRIVPVLFATIYTVSPWRYA
jgi:hypothetical protein